MVDHKSTSKKTFDNTVDFGTGWDWNGVDPRIPCVDPMKYRFLAAVEQFRHHREVNFA